MALPASFARIGFTGPEKVVNRKRLLIGTEGDFSTGKTEFILSCPGPGLVICLDRGIDSCLDNPTPPPSRRNDFGFKIITAPSFTQANKAEYLRYWNIFYAEYLAALANTDALTVGIDTDTFSWELQRLAEFGTLTNVPGPPGLAYTGVKAARRAMYYKAWDANKIIVATNFIKDEYIDDKDAQGNPIMEAGRPKRHKSGNKERQGFDDQGYLWHLQLRHLRKDAYLNPVSKKLVPTQFGIQILKCGRDTSLIGQELWGPDCNFTGLVQLCYPEVSLKEWGL